MRQKHFPLKLALAFLRFLNLRGNVNGPLFIFNHAFSGILKRVVRKLSLQGANFKAHSFRIGAASHWVQKVFFPRFK